jgi:hypothetical protein
MNFRKTLLIFGIIYQNKQSQKEKVINENLNPNLCSNETYSTEYLDYLNGEKFIDLNLESRKKFYENVDSDGEVEDGQDPDKLSAYSMRISKKSLVRLYVFQQKSEPFPLF